MIREWIERIIDEKLIGSVFKNSDEEFETTKYDPLNWFSPFTTLFKSNSLEERIENLEAKLKAVEEHFKVRISYIQGESGYKVLSTKIKRR